MEVSKDVCTDTANLRHRAVRLMKNKPLVTTKYAKKLARSASQSSWARSQ